MSTQVSLKSVCVIGAGVAGLCALRHLTARSDRFGPIVCYEQTKYIGGTWNYTDAVGFDENGLPVHTSMYKDLKTNAPAEIMEYPDFKWKYTCSFPPQAEVLQFINGYADNFNLWPYISFEHHLKKLSRDNVNNCWQLTVLNVKDGKRIPFTRSFDIVILCPGRNCIPLLPKIPGIENFEGKMIHSHDYRCRKPYACQRVAVLGAGPSGIDIAIQCSTVGKQVYLINRTDWQFEVLPENVRQIKGSIYHFTKNSIKVKMADNGEKEELEVDSVILATGYQIYLSYLDQEECGLRHNADDSLDGIYRHLINIKYPTMALFSILKPSINCFLYHKQMQYFIKLMLGEIPMPTEEQMREEVKADIEMRLQRKIFDRHQLKIPLVREYFKMLDRDANLEPAPTALLDLMDEVAEVRRRNPITYKGINYKLVGDKFEAV